MKKEAKLSLNYHQISSNTHLISSAADCIIGKPYCRLSYIAGYIWGYMAYTLVFSSYDRVNATDDQQRCGTAFCPKAELNKADLVFPDTRKVNMLYIYYET